MNEMSEAPFAIVEESLSRRPDTLCDATWAFYRDKMAADRARPLLKRSQIMRLLAESQKHSDWDSYRGNIREFVDKQVAREVKRKKEKAWQMFGHDLVKRLTTPVGELPFYSAWRDAVSEIASKADLQDDLMKEINAFTWTELIESQQKALNLVCSQQTVQLLAAFHRIHADEAIWPQFSEQFPKGVTT